MPKPSGFRFTRERIRELKPRDQAWTVFDTGHTGLGVRVYPSGVRAYVHRFKLGYKGHLRTLGWFPVFGDAIKAWEASRDEVNAVRHQRADGIDAKNPMVARKERAAALVAALSIGDGVDAYLKARRLEHERRSAGKATAGPGLRESTASTYEAALRRDFLKHPAVKGRTLRQLTSDDLAAVINDVAERGPAAGHQQKAAIQSLYAWAIQSGHVKSADSPARELPKVYAAKERDRWLSSEKELRALLALLDGDELGGGRAPRLALLLTLATGQRSGELLALTWADVDVGEKVLVIPARIAKTGKAHLVPLSAIALEIIGELRAAAGASPWLFPGSSDDDKPMQQQTLGTLLRRGAKVLTKHRIEAFTPHDLRRTCRSWLQKLKVDDKIGERILGHSVGNKVERTYALHRFADEQRAALDVWSDKLCDLRGRPASSPSVIAFPGRRA